MAETEPDPVAEPGPEASFREGLAAGEFRIQKCGDCNVHIFYPRAMCPKCGSMNVETLAASGSATVYSTSVVRVRPDRGGDYNIAVIELAEGPRMLSRVVEIEPADVAIGMAVEAFIGEIDETPVILFRPAAEG